MRKHDNKCIKIIKSLNQRTVSRAGDVHEGSLRAQKRLKELSSDALELTLNIVGSIFL